MNFEIKIRERRADKQAEAVVQHALALRSITGPVDAIEHMVKGGIPRAVIERIISAGARNRRPSALSMVQLLWKLERSQSIVRWKDVEED